MYQHAVRKPQISRQFYPVFKFQMFCKLTIILLYNFDYMTMISKNYRKQMDKVKGIRYLGKKMLTKLQLLEEQKNSKLVTGFLQMKKLTNQGKRDYDSLRETPTRWM